MLIRSAAIAFTRLRKPKVVGLTGPRSALLPIYAARGVRRTASRCCVSSFPLASSGSDRTSASTELLAVSLQARARVGLSFAWRSGRLRPSSSTARGIRPIHRSGAAEMRAARLLPSWHIGTVRACGRRWSQQTPTVGRPWRLAVAAVVERRREGQPGSLPGCRLSATLGGPTPRRLAISRARRQSRPGPVSRLHGCRLPHRQGADNEIADARTLVSGPCWRARGARERARGYYAAPGRAGSRSVVGIQPKCRRVRLRRATGARPEAQRRLRG